MMDWIYDWVALPRSLYDILIVSLYATGTALVILLIKQFFREQLSARWHLYIWTVLLARMTIRPEKFTLQSSMSLGRLIQPERIASSIRFALDSRRMGVDSSGNMAGLAGSVEGEAAGMNGPGAVAGAVGDLEPVVEGMSFIGRGSDALYEVPVKEFLGPLTMENAFQERAVMIYWIGVALTLTVFVIMYLRLLSQKKQWTMVGCLPKNQQALSPLEYQVYSCTYRVWDGDPKRKIEIYTAKGIDSPFVFGILRRTLVIPEEMLPIDDGVILHELVHLKHNHLAFHWMITLFRCLHFFNPVLWYAFRRMQNDCELLCDERVLRILGKEEKVDHEQYGQLLLNAMGRGKSYIPGTTSLSNGQKNVLTRIRRIREFWKLSGASGWIAFILTLISGAYCLCIPQGVYNLNELPTGFGFGTGVFDYNVYHAEKYRLSSPQEAFYGYGLALTEWQVSYEWLFLSDEAREERKAQKIENDEDGTGRMVDLGYLEMMLDVALRQDSTADQLTEEEKKDLAVDIINSRGNDGFTVYNFHRRTDGTYRGVIRIDIQNDEGPLSGSYGSYRIVEDHDVILGIRDGRYQVLADRNQMYLMEPAQELPELPFHAEVRQDQTIDYRMDCYEEWTSHVGTHRTARMMESIVEEVRP